MNARILATLIAAAPLLAPAQTPAAPDPKDTEVWQPEPPRVTPAAPGKAPSDAIVLFDGSSLDEWTSTAAPGSPAGWTVRDGAIAVRAGAGDIQTRREFGSYQLHLEWQVPPNLKETGQNRGNSGLFLASIGPQHDGYEVQILDCNDNKTYVNGAAASVYKQYVPLANACAAPGQWQTYDVIWSAPRFVNGKLERPAYVTVLHNGVLVQHHAALQGVTVHRGKPFYRPHGKAPIRLQDHASPVSFRNIWLRPLAE